MNKNKKVALLLLVALILVTVLAVFFTLGLTVIESDTGGRHADDSGAYYYGIDATPGNTITQGNLFNVHLYNPVNPPRTTDNSCCNLRIYAAYKLDMQKLWLVADYNTSQQKVLSKVTTIDISLSQDREAYFFEDINSSALTSGEHTLDVIFYNGIVNDLNFRLGTLNAGCGIRYGLYNCLGNNLAWTKIFILPSGASGLCLQTGGTEVQGSSGMNACTCSDNKSYVLDSTFKGCVAPIPPSTLPPETNVPGNPFNPGTPSTPIVANPNAPIGTPMNPNFEYNSGTLAGATSNGATTELPAQQGITLKSPLLIIFIIIIAILSIALIAVSLKLRWK